MYNRTHDFKFSFVEAEEVGSRFRFTGEQLDDNGLLYLRARYYHPALGVFTGLDPVENLNRYQYVSSNPINYADPSGLQEPFDPAHVVIEKGPIEEAIEIVERCFEDPACTEKVGAAIGGYAAVEVLPIVISVLSSPWVWVGLPLAITAYLFLNQPYRDMYGDGSHLRPPEPATTQWRVEFADADQGKEYLRNLRNRLREDNDCFSRVYRIQTEGSTPTNPLPAASLERVDPIGPGFRACTESRYTRLKNG